jgi:hypothetical protein
MQEILVVTLVAFAAYIFYVVRQIKRMTDALKNRERVYYMRVIVSAKDQNDLYSDPYHPFKGSIIVMSKPENIVQKINTHFNINENKNMFIEHVQALN